MISRIVANKLINNAPPKNIKSAKIENIKSRNVIGLFRKPFLYDTNHLKRPGNTVNVTNATEIIPIIDMVAIERNAGCLAKIKTPIPSIVVSTDKITDTL